MEIDLGSTSTAGRPTTTFAKIIPYNVDAIIAFDEVVDSIKQRGNCEQSHLSVVWRPLKSPLPVLELKTLEFYNSKVWSGCFKLELGSLRENDALEWRLGATTKPGPIDIPLTVNATRDRVQPKHATVGFNEHGFLVVESEYLHPYGVRIDSDSFALVERALRKHASILRLGNLEFIVQYAISDATKEAQFQDEKAAFFNEQLDLHPPLKVTSATPQQGSDAPMMFGGAIMLHGVIWQEEGNRVTYHVGSLPNGGLINVHVYKWTDPSNQGELEREMAAWDLLKPTAEIHDYNHRVCHLVAHGVETTITDITARRIHWVALSPYIPRSVSSAVINVNDPYRPEKKGLVKIFRNAIEGLQVIHLSGCVHQCVHPDRVGVCSVDPPRGAIVGITHMARLPEAGKIDAATTVTYPAWCAPEMQISSYDAKVDMWALGLVGFQMFCKEPLPWPDDANPWAEHYSNKSYGAWLWARKGLLDCPTNSVEHLVGRMLAWDAEDRIGAADALEHPCFKEGAAPDAQDQPAPTIREQKKEIDRQKGVDKRRRRKDAAS